MRVIHRPWPSPMARPAMSNEVDLHRRISLTDRWIEVDGRPAVPVSGELHFSRVPRRDWAERLRLLRSGGITIVSTYLFWIHHQPSPDAPPRFDDGLDVGAFVDLAAACGLDVVVRIGPWCHGEVRNGGFPDWVQAAPVRHRTDDPGYLELAAGWYAAVGAELASRCGPDAPIVGIQLENELIDQPEHLVTLKRLARGAGLSAPLWTATAWDGAELPADEVLPVYGGYGDGFWSDADAPWAPGFRAQFRFSHEWDDPGIGADVRGATAGPRPPRPRDPRFPAATCELGGGMATAYHRRPVPGADDVAAVAHVKLGSGSAWQGYYLAAGGLNPGDGLQESLATGYPNDLPRFDYDFHAPIGAAGELAPSHAALRMQHAFLEAFGDRLARMTSSLPDALPVDEDDVATPRWALRSDGSTGFLFVNVHRPHEPLEPVADARFELRLADREVVLPAEPIDLPSGTMARWPIGLELGGLLVRWATASAVTVLDGDLPTLVLLADDGVRVELSVGDDLVSHEPAEEPTLHRFGALDILVLPASDAHRLWVLTDDETRRLLRCEYPPWIEDGSLVVRAASEPAVDEWDAAAGDFRPVPFEAEVRRPEAAAPTATLLRPAADVPVRYGGTPQRTAAPDHARVAELAAAYELDGLPEPRPGVRRVLTVDWAGDVATLEVDDEVVADRFWDGTPWHVDLDAIDAASPRTATLRILPLHPEAPVRLDEDAAARRAATPGPLCSLDAVSVEQSVRWRERT
ncbi:beta-galactosidase [Agromyces mariniharenae]|uniref:Beta-galactosidase n=1 Tax=Agromyces mariniharenae TaxID=2604423 RepID=A0A5S4V5Y6_9MICO|nr:beta-galactosidase [Agromyces mariniharenae]